MNLSIGLVTHRGTRYPESRGESGLAHRIHEALKHLGVSSQVHVFDEDLWSDSILSIDRSVVRRSIGAELATEKAWRTYHGNRWPRPLLDLAFGIRSLRRRTTFDGWTRRSKSRGQAMVRRLVNIELAHVHLMRQAVIDGSPWALIMEDDAHGDALTTALVIQRIVSAKTRNEQPAYVNLSRSFSHERLGVMDGLAVVDDQAGAEGGAAFLSSDKPVTNTVCAILYRTAFVESLLNHLDSQPLDPVIPIDWKINAALMEMAESGVVRPGDAWLCEEPPVIQGSMHQPE